MAADFFSISWYRVERLKPRLRSHVQLLRQQYRGQIWYVLQDFSSERFHRFSPAAYVIIGLMDGRRTVRDIWEHATATLGDEAPTQDEVIRLLSQLHSADLIVCDVPPDTAELSRRAGQQIRRTWKARLFSVFAWRMPLCDPDRFLTAFLPLVRPLISRTAGVLWLLMVGAGIVLGTMHWTDLTHDLLDQVLAPGNLLLLWMLFPVIKLLHELGHGFTTKAFGGEVHELGMMLLVFTPVPYCEASAAWAFRGKWQRILVGGAGMAVELFLASLAMIVWVNAEPGFVRMLAYNTIFIAGVTTVLFNGNPLLRFDGYYMLMDWLEIPNLRSRALRYLGYLSERYLLGQHEAELPTATPGERAWFVVYGVASSIYRLLVVIGILLFLGDQWPLVAVVFAGLTAVTMIGVPLWKGLTFLVTSPSLRQVRARALGTTAGFAALVIALLCVVPAPFHTLTEGVVWVPDESFVRAGSDGFVERVVAQPGSRVNSGAVLIECRNPALSTKVRVWQARMKELEARYTEQRPKDLVKAAIIEEELRYAREELSRSQRRLNELTIRSRTSGTFVLPTAEDLPGRYVKQGDLLGHVVDMSTLTVRAVVPQADIDLVRTQSPQVQVRLAEAIGEALPAVLTRVVPAAVDQLPSAALGLDGGGTVPIDPTDPKGLKAMHKYFQVDLSIPVQTDVVNAGGRVYVRFTHDWVPLSSQWSRQLRQLFLSRFNV